MWCNLLYFITFGWEGQHIIGVGLVLGWLKFSNKSPISDMKGGGGMTVKTIVRGKDNLGVQMAIRIIEEGKRPMSPEQIKGKYQLEFPFVIKRVIEGYILNNPGDSTEMTRVGAVIVVTGTLGDFYTTDFNIRLSPKSERFVWVGGDI